MRLTLVVVEKHTRRAVHLRHDHALGTVHDEGTLVCHQRDIAEIDVLFFNVAHRTGLRVFIDIKNDETKLDLERRCVSQVTLLALFNVELRRFEFE